MKLFRINTKDDITNSTAAFMPGGRIFAAKNEENSTLRNYLKGLSSELFRIDEQMNLMSEDYDVNLTVQFIEQWESAVGIPDSCFDNTGTLVERRQNVLAKIAKMNLNTTQDFIDLASIFGVEVEVRTGISEITFPLTFPVIMFTTEKEARFTMIIKFTSETEVFPFTFPITFGSQAIALVKCLFNKLKPANVQIIYI
jgi:uncharacterized protein YmfQ (DUF2313 family)